MGKKQVINYKKLEIVSATAAESPVQAIEDLMVFDARCLDKETRLELVRLLPELTHIRRAWKAHFSVHGCVSCHRKRVDYGAGGFCWRCQARITTRMRTCFREVNAGRNIPDEVASLSRRYDAAQSLFNGNDCPSEPLPVKRVAAKSGAL
jgi:hypothetical protein